MFAFRQLFQSCSRTTLAQTSPPTCYIERLPDEILGATLFICAADPEDGLWILLQCTQVSRRWRQVSMFTPALWTHIHSRNHPDWIPEQLALSVRSPLSATMYFSLDEPHAAIISRRAGAEDGLDEIMRNTALVLEHRARIRNLSIGIVSPRGVDHRTSLASLSTALVHPLESPDWRTLSSVYVSIGDADQFWALRLARLFGGASVALPYLTSLSLANLSITGADFPEMPRLQELQWKTVPVKHRAVLEDLMRVLRRLPALKVLHLNHATPMRPALVATNGDAPIDIHPAVLPRLEELYLEEYFPLPEETHLLTPEVACARLLAHIVAPVTLSYYAALPVRAGTGVDGGYVVPLPEGLARREGACMLQIFIPTTENVILSMASERVSDGESAGGGTLVDIENPRDPFGTFTFFTACPSADDEPCVCEYAQAEADDRKFISISIERDIYPDFTPQFESPSIVSAEQTRLLHNILFAPSPYTYILKPRLPLAFLRTLCVGGVVALQHTFWAGLFEGAENLERMSVRGQDCVESLIFALFEDEVDWECAGNADAVASAPRSSLSVQALLDFTASLANRSTSTQMPRPAFVAAKSHRVRSAARYLNASLTLLEFRDHSMGELRTPVRWDAWMLFNGHSVDEPASTASGQHGQGDGMPNGTIGVSAWQMFNEWVEGRAARGCATPQLNI